MIKSHDKFFKIYIYVSLFIIVVLLASHVGALAYGSSRIKAESTTITDKVNSFNQSMNTVNKNLENINSQLEKQNTTTKSISLTGL